jgi:hypothetical protein
MTVQEAQNQLNLWIAADAAVAKGQSYSIGDMALTRANARDITDKIKFWRAEVARLSATTSGGPRFRQIIPRD